jgi:serine/threonine protein kinase/tetratricopeptide (TPR) repeat protein
VIGQTLSHYKIFSEISRGGMGIVYRAVDLKLDREVALKVLPPGLVADPERKRRFVQEAKAAAKLEHPHIGVVHEIDEIDGVSFIAMELIHGEQLRDTIAKGPLPLRRALEIATDIAEGLSKAHDEGIVHRDLKPANIMVTDDGHTKIIDFGLVKLVEPLAGDGSGIETLTRSAETDPGKIMGTVSYMSPEQARGQKVDHRTDIFSFGIVLYEMLAGEPPFKAPSGPEILSAIINAPVPSLGASVAHDAAPELQRIMDKCLAKDPNRRYQSARELLVDLRNLKRDSDSRSIVASRVKARRIPWSYAAMALVLVALAVGGFYLFSGDARRIDSLAVLPFENASGDPDTDYLSDGVTETIISNLSQLPDVRVISRNSAFRYKGEVIDAQEVGRELDVEAIVLGRIVERGEELTISAELVDTRDSSQIWGDRYTRESAGIFSVQDEIARAISQTLRLRLSGEDVARMTKRYTENTQAYQAYLKGRYYWHKRTEEGNQKAIQYFEEAIEIDPTYALAYSGLADSYNTLGLFFLPPGEAFPKAKAAAVKALEIDDALGAAHASLAFAVHSHYWEFPEAEKEYQRAIELNPGYALAHHWYGDYLSGMGRHDEAIAESQRAMELDPLSPIVSASTGIRLYMAGSQDQAIEQLEKTLEMAPEFPVAHWMIAYPYFRKGLHDEAIAHLEKAVDITEATFFMGFLGYAYGVDGRREEALRILENLQTRAENRYVQPLAVAWVYAGLGEKDRAFEWLEKAYEERAGFLYLFPHMDMAGVLKDDPRFADLVRRIGIAP